MFKKFRSNPRYQFLAIAGSLATVTTFLSMAAFLTDETDPFSVPFKMQYGEEFGIDIASTAYGKEESDEDSDNTVSYHSVDGVTVENAVIITPSGNAAFDPYIVNRGNYDVYVFIEVDLPESFDLAEVGSDWHRVDSITDKEVYAYSESGEMKTLSAMTKEGDSFRPTQTSALCRKVALDEGASIEQSEYKVQAIGYAIQINGLNTKDPYEVWELIGGNES